MDAPVCVWGLYINKYLQRPEESVMSPGAGVTGSCELPDLGATELQYSARSADTPKPCELFIAAILMQTKKASYLQRLRIENKFYRHILFRFY